jgi:hypothetical protein
MCDDEIVVLEGATWADDQRELERRGDQSGPRIAYRARLHQTR